LFLAKPMPIILPEDNPPDGVPGCQKCELAHQRTRVIWGEGNPSASIVVVLDNPGARENKYGEPYLCGTRETLQLAASKVGMKPEQLYVTYILKCRPIRAYDKPKARTECLSYLREQVNIIKPKIIVTLGNVATQSFLGEPTAEVKNLRGTIYKHKQYSMVVSYHPLAVRRRPVLNKYFLDDWKLVASILL